VLLVIIDDTTLLHQICKKLEKDLFTIGIQGQLKNHYQVQDSFSEHVKFQFQDGLLYRDGLFVYFLWPYVISSSLS
jgi:hypothetical protein